MSREIPMNKSYPHINGKLHLTGSSRFIADEIPLPEMLYTKFLFSPVAHANIMELDTSESITIPGVEKVVTASDIPGINQIGLVIQDEPLFPEKEIMYMGQPLAMVLATSEKIAEAAVKLIHLKYEELPPIFEIDEADEKGEWYIPEKKIECGDVQKALSEADFTLQGITETPTQEHFYLETQRCRAIPGEDRQIILYTATQSTMEVQEVVSRLLNLPANRIIVEVPRLGGAFGGKERGATIWAAMAALGCFLTHKPVQVLLEREEDMRSTGKRHPFQGRWKVGFDAKGKIEALDIELLSNGGAYADLSIAILERAMFHADNAYFIPNVRIRGRACRTNLPPNTAFRGFGAPQAIFILESILDEIAKKLELDPIKLRQINAYRSGDITPYEQKVIECNLPDILERLAFNSNYDQLKEEIEKYNDEHRNSKQGLSIIPVKFGISFTTTHLNQASALLWIYIDGTASLTTSAVEMGQEVSTKCATVVSKVLGIPLENIRVESSNSQRVGNASPTAASTGTDLNGNASRNAAEKIRVRLLPLAQSMLKNQGIDGDMEKICFKDGTVFSSDSPETKIEFKDLIRQAYLSRIPLGANGYYSTPGISFDWNIGKGSPFQYFVFGAALAQVQIDLLTGEHQVLKVFIVHETGISLNEAIDLGQIEGAFIQCYGWCTCEDLPRDTTGHYLAINPSTYKIPTIRDLPSKIQIEMIPSGSKYASIFGSKAIGEPPFIYGLTVWFAIQNAIHSVKPDAILKFPATRESILLALN